jgi:hypothetical protein
MSVYLRLAPGVKIRRDCSGPPLSFGDPDTLAWEIEQAET